MGHKASLDGVETKQGRIWGWSRIVAVRMLFRVGDAEFAEDAMTPGSTETEPSACKGLWVGVVDEEFLVDIVTCAGSGSLDADAIPLIGAEQVGRVRIFTEEWRLGLPIVTAESRGRIPVAAVAEIVEL